ncbi:hypothetical protein GCM10009738_89120 [Kitasatospora viridis]
MPLIAVGSVKGAPGVSTTALALATAWPGDRAAVVLEADPSGGDTALRFDLPDSPSLVTLAASARRAGLSGRLLLEHAHQLPRLATVVPGPAAPEQATAALGVLEELWGEAELDDVVAIADIGRTGLSPGPVTPLLAAADVLLLVTRGAIEDLAHAEAAVPRLRSLTRRIVVVVVGGCAWSAAEVGQVLGADHCAPLPVDDETAGILRGAPRRRRILARRGRPLPDAARRLAEDISGLIPEQTNPTDKTALAAALGGERT